MYVPAREASLFQLSIRGGFTDGFYSCEKANILDTSLVIGVAGGTCLRVIDPGSSPGYLIVTAHPPTAAAHGPVT